MTFSGEVFPDENAPDLDITEFAVRSERACERESPNKGLLSGKAARLVRLTH